MGKIVIELDPQSAKMLLWFLRNVDVLIRDLEVGETSNLKGFVDSQKSNREGIVPLIVFLENLFGK